MGDFNYKGILWENWSTPGMSESSEEFLFIEALRDCYLYQHVTQPTRVRHGQEPSILDLIITNEERMVEGLKYLSPLGKSDHVILSFDLRCYTDQSQTERSIVCYEKGNYEAMRKELKQVNWEAELTQRRYDVNKQWNYIKGKIMEVINKHIPIR